MNSVSQASKSVVGNHVGRSSSGTRIHYDADPVSRHTAELASIRPQRRGGPVDASCDGSNPRRGDREPRPRHDGCSKSHQNTNGNVSVQRRSSRHYEEEHINKQALRDIAKEKGQRNAESSQHADPPVSSSRRTHASHRETMDPHQHAGDRDDYEKDSSQRRGERSSHRSSHTRRCSEYEDEQSSSARTNSSHHSRSHHQTHSLPRRSRDRDDQRVDHTDRRRSSMVRDDYRDDPYDTQYRQRNGSQARRDAHDGYSSSGRRSSSSTSRHEYPREQRQARDTGEDVHMYEYCGKDGARSTRSSDARKYVSDSSNYDHRDRRRHSSTQQYDELDNDLESHYSYQSVQSRRSGSQQSLLYNDDLSSNRSSYSLHHHDPLDAGSRRVSDHRQYAESSSSRSRRRGHSGNDHDIKSNSLSLQNESRKGTDHGSSRDLRDRHAYTTPRCRNTLLPSSPEAPRNQPQENRPRRTGSEYRISNHSRGETGHDVEMSSSYRRNASPNEDHEAIGLTLNKHDISPSRRSSSSRSNHDTGFASSSSSPRRDDSQSRFSSDASPSRYGLDDSYRSRGDDSGRRHKAKIVSNSSLDVPGHSLRKDQSLSSSGRGDSSFEEPYPDCISVGRSTKKGVDEISVKSSRSKVDDEKRISQNVYDVDVERDKQDNAYPKQPNKKLSDDLLVSKQHNGSANDITRDQHSSSKSLSKTEASESASSSSTLRGGTANVASKASIADSISSLLGRGTKDQQHNPDQAQETPVSNPVVDRWRQLKRGILSDSYSLSSTSLSKDNAVSAIAAAATKLMSSLPRVHTPLSKAGSQPQSKAPSVSESMASLKPNESTLKESGAPAHPKTEICNQTATDTRTASLAKSEKSPVSNNDVSLSQISITPSSPQVASLGRNSVTSPTIGNHTSPSQRPSIISIALSSHNKRADAYAIMTETPESEDSGEMTPPPLDTEMKRRSKEVEPELTSFLPAEMSRREEKFHDAARLNDAAALRTLLKEKVNVNCRNSLDRTALHWAAANGNLDAVEVLIESKADLEAKDKYGMRAVLWSAWFGHIPVLRALVNAGANTRVTNKQGLGAFHCAAENNHVAVISFIFDALEPHDVNQRDKNERTPLHSAAEGGHVETVNRLLMAKVDLHKKDKGGMTAVHLASKQGHVDVLKSLLLQGVEVDDRDVDGKTALHLAAESGHKEVTDLLLDYTANPNSETVKEVSPLHLAAQEGHVDVCKSLVKYGCNVNAQNFQGSSALHLAANGNHKDVARVLVDAKCEVDLPNSRLQTALHVAVESGHLDVVQILLAGGASLETREKSGKSALQLAARGNYVAVVDMLIKAERYYAIAREYHDKDVGYVDPDTYLRRAQHPNAAQMKDVLWKLAMKQLKVSDWKRLAYYWNFTAEHVRAIEQEYTGTSSYKEHSFRLLNIWLHGVRKDENVLKLLFEALVAIDKKQLAEGIRRKVNLHAEKPCSPSVCSLS